MNLTRREVVDDQLNVTAINMIHLAVTQKDRSHIRSLKTAKEAWDKLDKLFLRNESIQSSHFDEVKNMADNFVMIEGESPEEMYRRLIALAVQMQDLGATFVDDPWIKRKFYNALLPYEEVKLTAIRQIASFRAMTSDEVFSEVIALDISKKNAEDLVARAHNTRKPNLALKIREREARFSKFSSNSGDTKVSFTKKPRAFIIGKYSYDEDEELNKEEEGVAAIAISTLFISPVDSPNESLITNTSRCLVAKEYLNLVVVARSSHPLVVIEMKTSKKIVPARTTKHQREAAAGARGPQKSMIDLKKGQFMEVRGANPYLLPRNARQCPNPYFHHVNQERIYNEVYGAKEFNCCPQYSISMDKINSNLEYFGEALEICEEQGLTPLMTFSHNYSKEVICQFYATVVFLEDEGGLRSLKWMTREHVMEATWEDFARGIGYELPDYDTNIFWIHLQAKPMAKEKMVDLYIRGRVLCGSAYNLLLVYDIMNCIYRSTINPKHTNHDEVHGFLVNLLVRTQEMRGRGKQLDVMDYIWHEMRDCAFLRKLPQYGPTS
ncbi:hypothetical protein QYE76_052222 [Lolium multiflorum]|uniref:Uncharacterized protein n=1 Tax=Lolium multiflorum TaxID=4521 RepID=A0AAD8STD8_LOLMU|nr:hypothetical protein QYE76_052222 [Lolium multiflorum]